MRSTLDSTLQQLYARSSQGIILGLDRVQRALDCLGPNPIAWPTIHIAGTNGKGSVAATCSLAMELAGYRVGMFTSPHLLRFAERIRINQTPIDDDLLVDALCHALTFDLSFFETSFVAALIAFHHAKIDCAVIEVGLGGRLDATNVITRPACACVTRVAMDHGDVLGHDIKQIAYEKASIAKHDCPMVIGPMDPLAGAIVHQVALQRGAAPIVDASQTPWTTTPIETNLRGLHQQDNTLVAAASCWCARNQLPALTEQNVRDAATNVHWPGRLELIARGPTTVLLDGAHNLDGVQALVRYLGQIDAPPAQTTLIFGAFANKSYEPMLQYLAASSERKYYVAPKGRAAAPIDALQRICPGQVCNSVAQALELACSNSKLVVVCGSLFLVAEARAHLLQLPTDPIVAL